MHVHASWSSHSQVEDVPAAHSGTMSSATAGGDCVSAFVPDQAPGQARSLSFTAAAARRALDNVGALRWTDDQPGFSTVHTTYAGRTGMCGNGLCEVLF